MFLKSTDFYARLMNTDSTKNMRNLGVPSHCFADVCWIPTSGLYNRSEFLPFMDHLPGSGLMEAHGGSHSYEFQQLFFVICFCWTLKKNSAVKGKQPSFLTTSFHMKGQCSKQALLRTFEITHILQGALILALPLICSEDQACICSPWDPVTECEHVVWETSKHHKELTAGQRGNKTKGIFWRWMNSRLKCKSESCDHGFTSNQS